jgi:hypothetical protein
LPWIHTGDANWLVSSVNPHGGAHSAQSGEIDDFQTSTLAVTQTTGAGAISFWYRISSESGYDFLEFSIDGGPALGSWSGEHGWVQVFYRITAGTHTFTWTYTKDSSVSDGADAAWIDDVTISIVAGDYNRDQSVDAADYLVWRDTLSNNVRPHSGADGSGNGIVGPEDYGIWRANFGKDYFSPTVVELNPTPIDTAISLDNLGKAKAKALRDADTVLPTSVEVDAIVSPSIPTLGTLHGTQRSRPLPLSSFSTTLEPIVAVSAFHLLDSSKNLAAGSRIEGQLAVNVPSGVTGQLFHDTILTMWLACVELFPSAKQLAQSRQGPAIDDSRLSHVPARDCAFDELDDQPLAPAVLDLNAK